MSKDDSPSPESALAPAAAADGQGARLALNLMQIVGDELFAGSRTDGTGFAMYPAPAKRQWMEATKLRYAYRCLPLAMANQLGYWLSNPVGFSVTWDGGHHQSALRLEFDRDGPLWSRYISSIFGHGILTWNMPFMFRTHPAGSQLLVTGPANRFKSGAQALQAIIETDWMNSSFTMNWRLLQAGCPVRFEPGEPILQALPLLRDQVVDLEALDVYVSGRSDDPKMYADYETWMRGRDAFRQEQSTSGGDGWQKDYFQGRDVDGNRQSVRDHHTKLRSRAIARAERLGLDRQTQPDEEDLTATAARPGRAELRIEASPAALAWRQEGESLLVDWPGELAALWRGSRDIELFGPQELRDRVRIGPEPGQLYVDTGLTLRLPPGHVARLRGPEQVSALWHVREVSWGPSRDAAQLIFTLQCVRTDVPIALRPGVLGRVELCAQMARLRVVAGA